MGTISCKWNLHPHPVRSTKSHGSHAPLLHGSHRGTRPYTWGSEQSRACAISELERSVCWSQNRNTGRKLVERKGICCPVLLFWAMYQGIMTLDCAEGKGPGEILRPVKNDQKKRERENKNTSTRLLLFMVTAPRLWAFDNWGNE